MQEKNGGQGVAWFLPLEFWLNLFSPIIHPLYSLYLQDCFFCSVRIQA